MINTMDLTMITDRFAIIDLVNRYFRLVDTKQWDQMDQIFIEDASIQETADRVIHGRKEILDQFRGMDDSEDIVLFDIVGNFTPFVDGDTAEADIPVRSSHHGVGAREGKFYESMVGLASTTRWLSVRGGR